jgi:DnaJ like chaperone protein
MGRKGKRQDGFKDKSNYHKQKILQRENVELIVVAIFVAILVYVSKSYFFYHSETNPYQGHGSDYDHPFAVRPGGDGYVEVLQSEYGLIAALMAKVAKADGTVCNLEQEIIETTLEELSGYFSHRENAMRVLREILEKEEQDHDNIELIASEFVRYTRQVPEKRIKIIEFLINLAFADKHLGEAEEEVIGKIAFYFQIPAHEYQKIMAGFKTYYDHYRSGDKDPYAVLGVGTEVNADGLKRAYRALVKENHPDVIKGRGLGDAFVDKATVRLQEINEAYETIQKHKGY